MIAPLKFNAPLAMSVFVAGLLAIYGSVFGPMWMHWLCKPLTTLMLVAAILANGDLARGYTRAILAGMTLSLLGDAALMRDSLFVVGLVLFLIAHIAYLVGLSHRVRFGARIAPFVLVGVLAALVLMTLWPSLPDSMRVPVIAYVAMLALMVSQAWVCYLERGDRLARHAAVGAAFFMFSDTLLALNRFLQPLPLAAIWVLASYWIGQTLIAISVNRADGSR